MQPEQSHLTRERGERLRLTLTRLVQRVKNLKVTQEQQEATDRRFPDLVVSEDGWVGIGKVTDWKTQRAAHF